MARPQRNDIDYFPHPVVHGKKMFYLRTEYGNDGYVVWFMTLEKLGKASYHYLDLKDEVEIMYLSAEFKVESDKLREILNCLVKLGEFDRYLWETESILYNEKFVENISDAYKKRTNDCINRESLISLLVGKGRIKLPKGEKKLDLGSGNEQNADDNPQSIVKDSKVNKSIEDRKTEFENSLRLFLSEYGENLLNDFYSYWTEKKTTGRKMRFEMERVFDVGRRLGTWKKNEKNFNKGKITNYESNSEANKTRTWN